MPSCCWTFGPAGWTSRHRALETAAGVMSRPLHDWGQGSADWSLYTAGPNNLDRYIRLDLLGLAAVGSGPIRSKKIDVDRSGMKAVETASRTRTGRDDQDVLLWGCGVIHSHVTVGIPHSSASTLHGHISK